jgi:hypothetical protein
MRNVSPEEILSLLEHEDDVLFERLGKRTEVRSLRGIPKTPQAYILAGKKWLDDQREAICSSVAKSQMISDFVKGKRIYSRVELVAATIDIIADRFEAPPVLIVAVLIVKNGFTEMCGEECFKSSSQ